MRLALTASILSLPLALAASFLSHARRWRRHQVTRAAATSQVTRAMHSLFDDVVKRLFWGFGDNSYARL